MPKPPDLTIPGLLQSIVSFQRILERATIAPMYWIDISDVPRSKSNNLEPLDCENYEEVKDAWKQAMVWTPGLNSALIVMLSSAMSTMLVGDQLWVKILSPASTGKTSLCEAIALLLDYVKSVSTIRGFHSGFGEGEHSLIDQVNGKCLVIKDGDTLLQSPGLAQILSEGRDLYDTVARSSYRNKASRDHIGVRFSWILAGTSSLRQIDHSELGQRFLDCVIMEGIDSELEKVVCLSAARSAALSSQLEVTGEAETRYTPEMSLAMRLTAGYLKYLRKNAADITSKIKFSEENLVTLSDYGIFVAHMRSRPSKTQTESHERELGARLTKQITKLSMCVPAVLNKSSIDDETMSTVKKVVFDTSRGDSLAIVQKLHASKIGMEITGLAHATGQLEDKLRSMLRFMGKIGIVDRSAAGPKRYKLTDKFLQLYLKTVK